MSKFNSKKKKKKLATNISAVEKKKVKEYQTLKPFRRELRFVAKRSSFTLVVEMLYLYCSLKFTSQQSISRMKQKAPWKSFFR